MRNRKFNENVIQLITSTAG